MTALEAISALRSAVAEPDDLRRRLALNPVLAYLEAQLVVCPYCGHETDRSTMTSVRDLPGCEGLEEADAMCTECVAAANAADALDAAKARPALRVVEAPFVVDAEVPW